jgi:hypothetical protein
LDHPTAGRVTGYLQRSRLASDTSARPVRLDLSEVDAAAFSLSWTKLHEVCPTLRHLRSLEAARRSRACAYLADDDHGPLALQEILLAGCPTVGVRTGASFVRTGETGVVVDRLPPGAHCAESDDGVRALAVFMEAVEQAQALDRHSVRDRAAEQFETDRIVASIIIAVNKARLGGGIAKAATV